MLGTDQYKFSMARAGYPLRQEAFYYSHRKGDSILPPGFDLEHWIRDRLPMDDGSLDSEPLLRDALLSGVEIIYNPEIKVWGPRDPIFVVKGASAIVSWLEPSILRLNRILQISTALQRGQVDLVRQNTRIATTEEEKDLTLQVLDACGVTPYPIEVRTEEYYNSVLDRTRNLVRLVGGDASRLFEVGMRATSCESQHEVALRAVLEAGVEATSNASLARKLGMKAVGTMGHEHIQRFGSSYEAFTAMRDRTLGYVSYLLDTYDTIHEGIPSALKVIAENPDRRQGIRFDSEHGIREQYLFAVAEANRRGLKPDFILESGWNDKLTEEFEGLRRSLGVEASRQMYGIGGFIVKPEWDHFSRDGVSAVYKLCQTGNHPTMKFGDEPGKGKESIPGIPYLLRPGVIVQYGDVDNSRTEELVQDLYQTRMDYVSHANNF